MLEVTQSIVEYVWKENAQMNSLASGWHQN